MDVRERFEYWYSDEGRTPKAVERNGDGYRLIAAHTAWNAWQAAIKSEREANDSLIGDEHGPDDNSFNLGD